MNCKDCLRYEVCKTYEEFDFADHSKCDTYKDKSKIVELPFKVGDMVYVLEYEDDMPVDYSGYIFIMSNDYFAFLSPTINGKDNPIEICNVFYQRSLDYQDNSGIIVPITEIFTKEEAEARLKELQNEVK